MVETWDFITAVEALAGPNGESVEDVRRSLRTRLDAGKGIAIYRNEDLGHPDVGTLLATTYGTPEAQFEPYRFPAGPPEQLPDGLFQTVTGGINWRYRLAAVVPPREG